MTVPRRSDRFVSRSVGGETFVVPVRAGVADLEAIFTMNEVGTAIWTRIDGQKTVDELARAPRGGVRRRPRPTAAADVAAFVELLAAKGLVDDAGGIQVKAEAVSYGTWSLGLHKRARGARLPINATIEVTHRCPLACAHCYNNLPVGDRAARARELSTDEHWRILDELADAGGLWLLFTGGEIFARADFLDIYKHAKSRGFLITLFTNGTQITPAIADTLVEWRPFAVEITLYGRTRETYERLTGVPGSFDRCMRGIRLLKERGLPVKLKTVAVTINRHEIADMQRFAEEELGVGFKFDGMINARIDCSHSPLDVRLTPSELVQLDLEDPVRHARVGAPGQRSPGRPARRRREAAGPRHALPLRRRRSPRSRSIPRAR